jgi:hypothetical protein
MPKVLTCDICGEEDASETYDGEVFCTYHMAEYDLRNLRDAYKEKRQWVKDVWFAELCKMREKIAALEKIMAENKPKGK